MSLLFTKQCVLIERFLDIYEWGFEHLTYNHCWAHFKLIDYIDMIHTIGEQICEVI